jgi:N-acetylmuramoyl-L-alanine amidase CwlA
MVQIRQNLISKSLYSWKSPYEMTPTRIVIHNTANDASADAEIKYMKKSEKQGGRQVSYHYAVDDKEIVQGIPENRNAWHAGDGNGKGNREGIAIEICYSKSGGERFMKAEQNAADLVVDILNRYGWGIDKVTKHQDYSGKYCPHMTLDLGWQRFLNMIQSRLDQQKPVETVKKSVDELALEVLKGNWGNGADRRRRLEAAGYSYAAVQARVNQILYGTKPQIKSIDEVAREVIRGNWGNGAERKRRLEAAGYNYRQVQNRVNELL